jgi:hypothetical protein
VWLILQFQVPLVLYSDVHQIDLGRIFLVFLNNLFLNINMVHSLLNINFIVIGTTRKNATRIPNNLLEVKNTDKKDYKQLI